MLSPLTFCIDSPPAFVMKHGPLLLIPLDRKERKTVPYHPDEIKRIYSLYKGKTLTMTCSLTHLQAQVP